MVEKIRMQAYKTYVDEAGDKLDLEGGKTKGFAMGMATWIEKEAKKLSKKYADPITEYVSFTWCLGCALRNSGRSKLSPLSCNSISISGSGIQRIQWRNLVPVSATRIWRKPSRYIEKRRR